MKYMAVFLLLTLASMSFSVLALPLESPSRDKVNSEPLAHIRVPRSPKPGQIVIKVENDNGKTSMSAEGHHTIFQNKYATVNIGGAIVKSPNEQINTNFKAEAIIEFK